MDACEMMMTCAPASGAATWTCLMTSMRPRARQGDQGIMAGRAVAGSDQGLIRERDQASAISILV